jgi:hypothetical protein
MRAAMVLAWLTAVIVLLLPWLRPRSVRPRPRVAIDQLVKDPVCQTYVVRSRAVAVSEDGVVRHFCSRRCAEQYAIGHG